MPHVRITAGLVAGLIAGGAFAAPAAPAASAASAAGPDVTRHQAQIDKIVAEISPKRIESYIRKLVSFETRHTMSETE